MTIPQFLTMQGDVALAYAIIAWEPTTKAFAVIRWPDDRGWINRLKVTNTHGAVWLHWQEGKTTRQRLSMLNAEVLAILLRAEADPVAVRLALNVIPEWREKYGDDAPWPFPP